MRRRVGTRVGILLPERRSVSTFMGEPTVHQCGRLDETLQVGPRRDSADPSGAKARIFAAPSGTAEAVPFPNSRPCQDCLEILLDYGAFGADCGDYQGLLHSGRVGAAQFCLYFVELIRLAGLIIGL